MINLIQNSIGALARRLGVVTKNLQMWLGFTKADVLGVELVVNGDFATDSDWTYDINYWSISGGRAIFNNTSSKAFYQSKVLLSSKSYKVSFDYEGTGEVGFLGTAGGLNELKAFTSYNQGYNSFVITPTTSTSEFNMWGNWTGAFSISNISVKEVAQFIPDKSTNTNNAKLFTGKALSCNGNDYVDFGSDINSNGAIWTCTMWLSDYIASGNAFMLGDGSFQNIGLKSSNGKVFFRSLDSTYNEFDYSGYSDDESEARRLVFASNGTTISLYVNSDLIDTITPSTTNLKVSRLMSGYNTTQYMVNGTVSDFQIYNEAWNSDDAAYDYANPNNLVFNNSASSIALSNLKGYYALSEGSGSIAYDSATPLGSEEVVNGNFATDSNWTKGAGWSIANGTAIQSGGTGQLFQTGALTAAKSYSVTVTIDSIASGTSLKVVLGSGGSELVFSNVGTTTLTGTAALDEKLYLLGSGSGFSATISNISVKEVSAGTITGATYDDKQPTIPQLGMMDWAKSTPDGTNEVTLIEAPNDLGKDILGNALRLRDGGFNLDGSGYGEVADDSTVNPTTAITVQCWIQSNTESNKGLVAKWTNAEKDYMLLKTTSKFKFYIGANNGESGTIPTSGWVNIAGTYDGANIKTYIDGVLSTTTPTTGSIPNSTNILDIGRYNNSQYYSERIDEVMVYNIALTQKEITNNYKAGLSKHS